MRACSATGQTTVTLYGENLKALAEEERQIKQAIQEMLENDGFYMLYQPQVDVRTRQLVGFEALARTKRRDLPPGKFIPVAEKNGLIWKIGRVTTELVVQQITCRWTSSSWINPSWTPTLCRERITLFRT